MTSCSCLSSSTRSSRLTGCVNASSCSRTRRSKPSFKESGLVPPAAAVGSRVGSVGRLVLLGNMRGNAAGRTRESHVHPGAIAVCGGEVAGRGGRRGRRRVSGFGGSKGSRGPVKGGMRFCSSSIVVGFQRRGQVCLRRWSQRRRRSAVRRCPAAKKSRGQGEEDWRRVFLFCLSHGHCSRRGARHQDDVCRLCGARCSRQHIHQYVLENTAGTRTGGAYCMAGRVGVGKAFGRMKQSL